MLYTNIFLYIHVYYYFISHTKYKLYFFIKTYKVIFSNICYIKLREILIYPIKIEVHFILIKIIYFGN